MTNHLTFCLLCIILVVYWQNIEANECPISSKVLTCTPKCLQDSDCSSFGGKCCSNICNGRSCVQRNQLLQSSGKGSSSAFSSHSSSGFGGKNSGTGGNYCGNVKCSPYERCDTDRATKRPKCVRS